VGSDLQGSSYNPRFHSHPASTLSDLMEARSVTVSELSDMSGIDLVQLKEILSERAPIGPKEAEGFERAFGGPSKDFWLRRQKTYNKHEESR
jgi:plasmid maintenance system antidote protein VapI